MFHTIGFEYEKFKFPAGEQHVRLKNYMTGSRVSMVWKPSLLVSEEIIELLLLGNAIKHAGLILECLDIVYLPFGRQDRIALLGESLSIEVMADVINSLSSKRVNLIDPHSDISSILIKNCSVTSQDEVFAEILKEKKDFFLVSPDGGALKKIYKLAGRVGCLAVIECSKQRNVVTGEITGIKVFSENLEGKDCYMVDDICDGGRTFIEIAKILRERNAGKIILCVTHGLFTKGLGVFDGVIDEIYTYDGKVK